MSSKDSKPAETTAVGAPVEEATPPAPAASLPLEAATTAAEAPAVSAPLEAATTTTAPIPPAIPEGDAGGVNDEPESEFGDDFESTASLTDSIRDFRNLHGRTYGNSHSTEYWAPNDNQQAGGLDITHHYLLLYHDNKLFQAPISDDVQKVLDVGTGTGIWAIDFADQYPSAHVIGTDISPIQPPWVPPNCEFVVDDAQLDWTWPENHFDYIHLRDLYGGISDWGALYKRAYAHLKPGGWFEDQEFDIRCHSDVVGHDPDHIYNRWNDIFAESGERLGKTLKIGRDSRMRDYMAEAGFVNCTERKFRLPINGWCRDKKLKEIGMFVHMFVDQSLEGFALFLLTKIMGWKYEECQVLVAQMRAAVKDTRLQPYYEVTLVYGQKPESSSTA
ncbi:related to methyltransferase [Cephalotrichum gorgonifer]|uniref:Related to methyltransferase n=1 Tax=Cephalotrichum gorgonifer TaxID=2041049 RepID=A0AAE8N6T5_9PEZI|nr:related to methyltransferase [Cephalotrichum gorgonifer]